MQALRERFKGDPQKMNAALMELYKTEKVNPLGGCLPVVIQIPVFISLYWVLLSSVEMRGAPWIGWIHDLSQQDPFFILPVLMAVSMFIQTRSEPDAAGPCAGQDDDVHAARVLGHVLLLPGGPRAVLRGEQRAVDRPAVLHHADDGQAEGQGGVSAVV
jgi:YidC/Oxa1 family membrane protein insertase